MNILVLILVPELLLGKLSSWKGKGRKSLGRKQRSKNMGRRMMVKSSLTIHQRLCLCRKQKLASPIGLNCAPGYSCGIVDVGGEASLIPLNLDLSTDDIEFKFLFSNFSDINWFL
jgi:hypothetical protein